MALFGLAMLKYCNLHRLVFSNNANEVLYASSVQNILTITMVTWNFVTNFCFDVQNSINKIYS